MKQEHRWTRLSSASIGAPHLDLVHPLYLAIVLGKSRHPSLCLCLHEVTHTDGALHSRSHRHLRPPRTATTVIRYEWPVISYLNVVFSWILLINWCQPSWLMHDARLLEREPLVLSVIVFFIIFTVCINVRLRWSTSSILAVARSVPESCCCSARAKSARVHFACAHQEEVSKPLKLLSRCVGSSLCSDGTTSCHVALWFWWYYYGVVALRRETLLCCDDAFAFKNAQESIVSWERKVRSI